MRSACTGLLGAALLAFTWIAPRLDPLAGAGAPHAAGKGLAGYDFHVRGPTEALARLAQPRPGDDLEELNRLVFESLAHGPPRPIRLTQNWLAWSLGLLRSDLRMTQDPERILRGGRGLCSDAVIVLQVLCAAAGLDAAMVDLDGHVVARVRRDGETWIADPDLGVVLRGTLAGLSGDAGRARVRAALLAAGHPPSRVQDVVAVFGTPADDAAVPAGVLNPRLARIERVLDLLRWLLPAMLAVVGLRRRGARPA